MEPFTPDDPLWKLMGKARPVVPRPNFTQNVLRAARQQPQATGWFPRASEWFAAWRLPLLSGAALALVLLIGLVLAPKTNQDSEVAVVTTTPALTVPDADMEVIADNDVSVPLDSLDHMDALVAMEDTSALSDTDLQFLLY